MVLLRYIGKRLLQSLLVVFIVTIVAFCLVRLAPGDPAVLMLGEQASEEQIAATREYYGLDKPLITQYLIYIRDLLHGDLGDSFQYKTSVASLIRDRIGYTITLALASAAVAIVLCVPLGIAAGSHRGKPIDFFAVFFALLGQSMSVVWLAVFVIYIFSVKLGWLPAVGGEGIVMYILPSITVGYPMAAELTRVVRSGMIDALGEDYITATYARGVSRFKVNSKYAFRNAACPMITLAALTTSTHLAGSIVVETVFSIPGIGQLMYRSIGNRDYAVVQSLMVIFAIMFTLMNLLVDIVNSIVDPRISLE